MTPPTPPEVPYESLDALPGRLVLQVRLSESEDSSDVFYVDVDVLVGLDEEVLYEVAEAVLEAIQVELRGLDGVAEA